MGRNAELRAELHKLEHALDPGAHLPDGGDRRMVMGFAVVSKSIIKLEETSYFLSVVNIILACLLALFAGLQIWVMLRGH